ncbi:sodium-dependent bicarbonate transport family permease [Mucilaginibacter flavidus]|uniref:sodium-dependent bicarbonate transport family permease n=1 Tax=Mucilaginibacter flavidus TaxID=2949309 RepID=UPI0035132320
MFCVGYPIRKDKSDLEIPPDASRFISLYLLFSIGFKGGQELEKSHVSPEVLYSILLGVSTAILIPLYSFFILRKRLNVDDSGAIAAAYGSVSAVTFVTAGVFLENQHIPYGGHINVLPIVRTKMLGS